jgi:hypothetical protein
MQSKRGVIMSTLTPELAVAHEWPCAEIHKTDEKFEVDVETPTFGPNDMLVEVEGHTLTVQGRPEHGHDAAGIGRLVLLERRSNENRQNWQRVGRPRTWAAEAPGAVMFFMDLSAELAFAVIAIGAALAAISLNEQRRDRTSH